MSIAPLVIVPTLGAMYAYSCVHYVSRKSTEAEKAFVKKQALWTAAATFVLLIIAGILILP